MSLSLLASRSRAITHILRRTLSLLVVLACASALNAAPARAQWTRLQAPGLAGVFLFGVEFPSSSVGYAIGSRSNATGIYKSTDGGASWAALKGIGLVPSVVTFLDERTGLAGGRAVGCGCLAISRTTDGGGTWKLDSVRAADGRIDRVPSSFGIYAFSFPSDDAGYAIGTNGTILKSLDRGASWRRLSGADTTDLIANVSFADADHGYAIASPITNLNAPGILYRTADGGKTWARTLEAVPGAAFAEIAFIAPEVGFLGGTDGGAAIYRTADGGAHWTRAYAGEADENIYAIAFVDARIGYAVGSNGAIVRTTDGGESWTAEASGTTETLEGIAIVGESVYVVGSGGVLLRRAGASSGIEGMREDRSGLRFKLTSSEGGAEGK